MNESDVNHMEDLNLRIHNLTFECERSARYHERRAKFFSNCSNVTKIITFFSASGFVTTSLSNVPKEIVAIIAGITAFLSVIDLVIGAGKRELIHHNFLEGYRSVLRQINTKLSGPDKERNFEQINQDFYALGANAPTTVDPINDLAYNETVDALGLDETHKINVGFWRHAFACLS